MPVPLRLWVAYRSWVDKIITARSGRAENFHSFVYAHTLGLPNADEIKTHWSGADAADLLACLADAGLLARSPAHRASDALTAWLEESLVVFDSRFLLARERVFHGLDRSSELKWSGPYEFIQLADPQLGMLHWDRDWTEELTMLRLAVQHVNRLRPRFLLISGDLINAFPTEDNEDVVGRQVASFKEALHQLSPSIPLVLQPGNHDIGQQPTPMDVRRYRERFGDDYFSFWAGGVMYVALNSQYYRDAEHTAELRDEQDAWAHRAFAEATQFGAKHVVVLSHVPPFVCDEDEQAGWANWKKEHRAAILKAAAEAGAKLWLSGHYHGNANGTSKAGIEVVTTSSCGGVINWTLDPQYIAIEPFPDFKKVVGQPQVLADARHSGMRIVRVTEAGFVHRWFELANVPATMSDAFRSRWSQARDKYAQFALGEVMGLKREASHSFTKRESGHAFQLPERRARSMCTEAELDVVRAAASKYEEEIANANAGMLPRGQLSSTLRSTGQSAAPGLGRSSSGILGGSQKSMDAPHSVLAMANKGSWEPPTAAEALAVPPADAGETSRQTTGSVAASSLDERLATSPTNARTPSTAPSPSQAPPPSQSSSLQSEGESQQQHHHQSNGGASSGKSSGSTGTGSRSGKSTLSGGGNSGSSAGARRRKRG